jgi:hypothetical protein
MSTVNLSSVLGKVQRGAIEVSELAKLIHHSAMIIQAYLRHMRSSAVQLCDRQGLTIADLSQDCIADAFARDADGIYFRFIRFVDSLQQPLDRIDPQQLFLAYRAFLSRVADAQLARLFAQTDPIGAKIHRNVKLALRGSEVFRVRDDFRGTVLEPLTLPLNDRLEGLSRESLASRVAERANGRTDIPELLQVLHGVLAEEEECSRAVTLFDVVQVFRAFYIDGRGDEDGVSAWQEEAGVSLEQSEFNQIRVEVERALREKIVVGYLAKGKMDRDLADAVAGAFHDLLDDWLELNDQRPLYDYLARRHAVSRAEYESGVRPKMEYLLKLAREEFRVRLERNL